MQQEIRNNGEVWSSFKLEEAKSFLEGEGLGVKHPSRLAMVEFLNKVKAKKTWKILDLPCGAGVEYPLLSSVCAYTGMDKTLVLVEALKAKYPDADVKLGDIRAIPCEDNSYDIVYARAIFEHLCDMNDVRQAMKECYRVAKKYAVFSFYLPLVDVTNIRWNGSYFENLYAESEVLEAIKSLGAKNFERVFVDVTGTEFKDSYHMFFVEKV